MSWDISLLDILYNSGWGMQTKMMKDVHDNVQVLLSVVEMW